MRYVRTATARNSRSSDYTGGEGSDFESGNIRAHKPDYTLPLISACLLAVGLVIVYSISPGIASSRAVTENYIINKQLLSIALGIIGFVVATSLPISFWKKISNSLIVLSALSALIVYVAGEEINGAQRWVTVGGISFQVAELFKLTLAIWLGIFLSKFVRNKGDKSSSERTMKVLGGVVLGIGVVVAGFESDLGSAAVMIAMIAVGAFLSGLSMSKLLPGVLVIALVVTVAIAISPYRRDRLKTFLNPASDCQNAGYQACQALITVGSGGVFGTGLSRGVQAYGYLPEAANDSIFAVISEKLGFIGSSILLWLYVFLFLRLKRIIDRAPDAFTSLFVSLILIWLSVQTIINVGAMIGLLPLKGITLPFISYGGTSLLFIMIAIGIVFKISRYTRLSGGERRNENRNERQLQLGSRR